MLQKVIKQGFYTNKNPDKIYKTAQTVVLFTSITSI